MLSVIPVPPGANLLRWRFHFLALPRRARDSSRSSSRVPPFHALPEALAFPSIVRGPVECSHGREVRICSDSRALRSGVQPFAIIRLQFDLLG